MNRALVVAALLVVVLLPFNAPAQTWQQGFDFRATSGYVTDPPTATYVLVTTAYPTTRNGVTFGWANTGPVQSRDRSTTVDPRLAGINYVSNGSQGRFYVDLPSAGTYNLSLAMGDGGYPQCWTQCQVQFLDGSTVVATVTGGLTGLGFFYDASGQNWSAAAWPGSNVPVLVTMMGTRLTVVVGTSVGDGYITPIAFLGVTQGTAVPNFTISASPTTLSVVQGSQGSSTITTAVSGGFNSAINMSASGVPTGTTVGFSPNPIPAPGSGNSAMTITVGSNTAVGTYPIVVTGSGGGTQHTATVTLTVTAPVQPDFTLAASPGTLSVGQGNQGTSTMTTTVVGGFNNAINLTATGAPAGTTLGFNPSTIPAPGAGTSTMTITVGASTPLGTYPIVVTGSGGGTQHTVTVTLTVTTAVWQQGFDFRATSGYVTDPPTATYVLATTAYPTTRNGVTFGWANTGPVQSRDRSTTVDPRLAGINYVSNGSQGRFYVDLPSAGTYNLSLAMGDGGYPQCWTQCQVQFLDGSTVVATVTGGLTGLGFFYDASGQNWSAAAWPGSNVPVLVTMMGTRLTVVVGTSVGDGYITPIAFLGVTQGTAVPNFTISASPTTLSVVQGSQGSSTITTAVSGGFNSAINMSASGVPTGTTVGFSPNPIPAPGSGNSAMTITVGSNTAVGTYPIVVTGSGGGTQHTATVTLTVTAPVQPDFTLAASPGTLSVGQGNQGTSTMTTTVVGGFNNAINLTATGAPAGTTLGFNPSTIPAPGAGTSTMTITVGASTPLGTYPIVVTGSGGGTQHTVTVTLTVTTAVWQQGFDFRATSGYVTDPPTATYVLATTAYPTTRNGVTFGWANTALVQSRNRSNLVDPRLAGVNYVSNGSPATFYVNLPSAGTYNLSLAMGDEGFPQCGSQCQIQFLDGGTVVATLTEGPTSLGYFYDATGRNWSAAAWPGSNVALPVTMSSSQLTVVVGTNNNTQDLTPIAFLGVTQLTSVPSFNLTASPSSMTVAQGNQGATTLTTSIGSGFNSSISLAAAGVPMGTTVNFNPTTIPAPGAGTSSMTVMVTTSTPPGTYPITVTGTGGGVREITTVTLTVTAGTQPDFSIAVSPEALSVAQGAQGTATVYTGLIHGFNNAINLTSSGAPAGVTIALNPATIPAPGSGSSVVTISVSGSTPLGTYPITVTGAGGGVQHSAVTSLTVTSAVWQQGFDFRNTASFVSDPPSSNFTSASSLFPTSGELATYGWDPMNRAGGSDHSTTVDPRLAGIDYATNGSPAAFYVELPAPGTYSVSLAMGDAIYSRCAAQCQIQFLDGSRVIGSIVKGPIGAGSFYDAQGNPWSAGNWPTHNAPLQLTLTGTELTALVGTNNNTGDITPIAYLGVKQVTTGPTFALEAPTTISVGTGEYGTADVSTVLVGPFNSAISLSATGGPAGATIAFSPTTLPAPGAGTAIMTITVPSGTALGTYSITLTATGGSVIQNAVVSLTVTAATQPDFRLNVPASVGAPQGSQGNAPIFTTITGSFNSAISLTASGAPNGTVVTFSPSSIPAPGAGSSTMTVSVSSSVPMGSYPFTVTGVGGGANHSANVTLTVSKNGNVNLPAGTGWTPLGSNTLFCPVSPGSSYFNPQVGEIEALDFLSLCQLGSMVAYSGGAVDPTNDQYFLWTSGHNNYQGNEMYKLDLKGPSPTVSRLTDPSWTVLNTDVPEDCACRGTTNCGQGLWHDNSGNPVSSPYAESGFSGPTFESTPAPDGSWGQPTCGYGAKFQPNARETYAGIVYHPTSNKVVAWGGALAADPTRMAYSNWSLDLNQQPPKWTRLRDSSYVWFTAAVYDYTTNHPTSGYDLIFDENTTLYAYNAASDTYVTLASAVPFMGSNVNMELDPVHHSVVLENGDSYGGYHLRIINLDSCNGTTCAITNLDQQVSCQGTLGYWAGMAWDSKRNVMAIFPSSDNCTGAACTAPFNTAYLLNTDPANPVTVTYQGSPHTIPPQQCLAATYGSTQGVDYPPESVGPGVYSRFAYYPNEDIYLFIQHPDQPVWILRLE